MEQEFLRALAAAWPSWVLLDSELQLGGNLHADWVGRDHEGTLLLVSLGAEDAAGTTLLALQLSLRAREQEAQLLKRYGARALLVVLLLDPAQSGAAELLAPLALRPLVFMECREWRSAQGVRLELHKIETGTATLCVTRETALGGLGAGERARAERIAATLESPAFGAGLLPRPQAWDFVVDGRGVCSIAMRNGRLEGLLAAESAPLELESPENERDFIDRAVADVLRMKPSELDDSAEITAQKAFDPREPVLTREELEAFRQSDSC